MGMKTEWVRYGGGQEFSGVAMWPERATLPLPAVIVIQEAWGVDAHIEDVTCRFAQAGYVAFAPDLFSRNGERVPPFTKERLTELQAFINSAPPSIWMDAQARTAALALRPPEEAARLGETMGALFGGALASDKHLPAVLAASSFLRNDFAPSRGQKIAAVGYCMGGALSGLLACHDPELKAAVVFYGSAPAADLMPRIQCPVLAFTGSLDKRLVDALPAFAADMKKAGRELESHLYEGVQHAFFNDRRPSYSVGATRDSFVRTLELFRRVLA